MSIKKLIRFLFFLLYITIPTKAFAIEPGYYSTITFSIGAIGAEGLTYDESLVDGTYTSDLVGKKNIVYLANYEYRRRITNQYDSVSLPPFSEVDVGYFFYNCTPETVDVESIRIPLSQENLSNGDTTDILYDTGFEYGDTCTPTMCRNGKFLEVEGIGLVDSQIYENPGKGVVIGTVKIKPAVEITKYEIEYWDEKLSEIVIYVQNNTGEYLEDIIINYKTVVNRTFDLEPYEEKVFELYKKCTLTEDEVNCGSMKIYDNNRKKQCAIQGSFYNNFSNPGAITVFNRIGDEWISGAHLQPSIEGFCIERIPYTYTTPDMIAYVEPQEPEITTEEYWEELLDIEVLPITSYQFTQLDRYLALLKPLGIDNL